MKTTMCQNSWVSVKPRLSGKHSCKHLPYKIGKITNQQPKKILGKKRQ
jgi:hypothetical protein